jgi:AcrR family transcriptional regulator
VTVAPRLGAVDGDGTRSAQVDPVAQIQRARVLAATFEVYARHGAASASVTHIVQRAGVSRRTFYELFADRDECLLAALDDALLRARAAALPCWRAPEPWPARLRGAIAALLCFFEDDPPATRLLLVESLAAGPAALARRAQALAALAAAVDEGRESVAVEPPAVDEGRSARTVEPSAVDEGRGSVAVEPPAVEEGRGARAVEPFAYTAEGVVGGMLSIVQTRVLADAGDSLSELAPQLCAIAVLPYLGAAAARREAARPAPRRDARAGNGTAVRAGADGRSKLGALPIRLTHRTIRVLLAIGTRPGASNRAVAAAAGVLDQGQISKLLRRLERVGLIENTGAPAIEDVQRGLPNAWRLTDAGEALAGALGGSLGGSP